MAQISNCLKLISKIDERDQDALVARLDELQDQGMPAERAQIQAAIDVLTRLQRESSESNQAPALTSKARAAIKSGVTETPEFKRWFGDSKVVDGDGRPRVMYHGSGSDFTVYAQGRGKGAGGRSARLGFFFTASADVASSYAEQTTEFERTRGYEKVQRLEAAGKFSEAERLSESLEAEDFTGGMAPNVQPVYLAIKNPMVVDFEGRSYDPEQDNLSEIIWEAKEAGHDGVMFRNIDDAPVNGIAAADQFVAFRPEQIKSAIGNSGAFDPSDPSIIRSRARAVDLWKKYAEEDSGFKFGRNDGMSSKSASEIAKAFSSPGARISADETPVAPGWIQLVVNGDQRNGRMTLKSSGSRWWIDSTDAYGDQPAEAPSNDQGQRMYQALFAYAKNNGIRVDSDYTLSNINELRRTSAMLSSALRLGSTDHFGEINEQQGVDAWIDGDFDHNVEALATAEMRKVASRIGVFDDLSIDNRGAVATRNAEAFPGLLDGDRAQESMGARSGNEKPRGVSGEAGAADAGRRTAAGDLPSQGVPRRTDGRAQGNAYDATGSASQVGDGAEVARTPVPDSALVDYLASTRGGFESHGVGLATLKRALVTKAAIDGGIIEPQQGGLLYSKTREVQRPEFYSQLQRSIEQVPDRLATMAAPQWKLWLDANAAKLGVKKDEIEWSGVKDYLTLRGKDKVTRDDLVAYLDSSGVRVQETVLGKPLVDQKLTIRQELAKRYVETIDAAMYADASTNPAYIDSIAADERKPEEQALLDAWNAVNENTDEPWTYDQGDPTKYDQYTVPGGENYREVLITLPPKQSEDQAVRRARRNEALATFPQTPESRAILAETRGETSDPGYKSSHWDAPNILAHLRVDDRTDADGNRVLFINEIQSDWSSDGRKNGFAKDKGLRIERQGGANPWKVLDINGQEIASKASERAAELFIKEANHGVPRAPFVEDTKSYVALALKRAIMMAVEGGHDKIAFITGQQAADLYDLSKRVDSVLYEKVNDKDLWEIEVRGLDGETIIEEDEAPASRLEELIGKELAQKIVNGDGEKLTPDSARDWRRLSGLDLKVGGEGMRAFYDQIIPQVARDVLKKLGGGSLRQVVFGGERDGGRYTVQDAETGEKVFSTDVKSDAREYMNAYGGVARVIDNHSDRPSSDGFSGEQPGFDITPAMREKVAAGVPLFSKTRPQLASEPYVEDLYGQPVDTQPTEPGVSRNAQRKPRVRDTDAPEGIYHINTVVAIERKQKLGAKRITNAAELAAATAHLRKSAVERFDGVVTDAKGKPLAIVGSFKGALSQAAVYPSTIIAEAVRVPGAARIWFSHNHPSGAPSLSLADHNLYRTLANAFSGSGIEPMGLIAVARDRFGFTDGNGESIGSVPDVIDGPSVYIYERELAGDDPNGLPILSSAEIARDAAKGAYALNKEPGVLLLDSQHRVVAVVPIDPEVGKKLRGTGGLNSIFRSVSQSNAGAAIIYHAGEYDLNGGAELVSPLLNIGAALNLVDVRPLDAINVKTNESRAEKGLSMAAGPVFSKGRTTGGADWESPSASKFDELVYKFQDKQIETKRVVEAIKEASGALSDDLNVYLNEELYHGRAAKRTEDFINMELNPLITDMAKANMKIADLEEFLHARHAKEANAVIAQRNPGEPGLQDGGSGMTNSEADNYMATLPAADRKVLEAAAAKVDAIIGGTRKMFVDYELESQATVDGWDGMFKHYVPLQREDKEGSPGLGQGFSIKGKETKGRTGSTRKVVDILANIAMQRERAIVRGEKNRVAQSLVGLVRANENPDFWLVDEVPTERVFNPATGLVEDRVDPMYKSRENAVVAKIKDPSGAVREHAVLFNEEDPRALRMAKSLKNLDATQLEGMLGLSAKITRYFAAINTQWNPVFGVVNLVRDVQGAMLNLSSTPLKDDKAKIARYTASALAGIYSDVRAARKGNNPNSQWSKLWDEFQEVGGQTGYRDLFTTSADRAEAIQKALDPNAWMDSKLGKVFTAGGALKVPVAQAQKQAGFLFDWLSDYNNAMENGVRLAAYKAGLERGMTKQQAASAAKNLTTNFNRKGQVAQQAGAMYAFFNAAIQGTARIGQTLFDMEPGKPKTMRLSSTGKKIVYGGIVLGSVQALALAAAGFGEEDPPEFARERNLIIPTGGKTYVSIPMPLGMHIIPNIGRVATEFVLSGFKDPIKRGIGMAAMFADAFNPIGNAGMSMQTLAPTALDPLVALTENKDWTGRPIAKTSFNKATPGHALGRDTATALSELLSESINTLSGGNKYVAGVFSPTPDQIDFLLGQLTGGVGREYSKTEQTLKSVVRGESLPTYKIPLVGRFVGNAKGQASEGSAFYANVDKLNEIETEVKGLRQDGKDAEARKLLSENPEAYLITQANYAERQAQKLRRQKSELIKAGAPREQVKAVEEQITAVMARLNRAMERLKGSTEATAQ